MGESMPAARCCCLIIIMLSGPAWSTTAPFAVRPHAAVHEMRSKCLIAVTRVLLIAATWTACTLALAGVPAALGCCCDASQRHASGRCGFFLHSWAVSACDLCAWLVANMRCDHQQQMCLRLLCYFAHRLYRRRPELPWDKHGGHVDGLPKWKQQ